MPTAQELYNQMVAEAQAAAAAPEVEKQRQIEAQNAALHKTVNEIGSVLPKVVETTSALAQRMEALEKARATPPPQTFDPDEELVLTRGALEPIIAKQVEERVTAGVNQAFEKNFGPAVREANAIKTYQGAHPDFDFNKTSQYLNKNPEVAAMVEKARQNGAFEVGIEYAELRRTMDERIAGEARVTGGRQKRTDHINATRGDAGIIGATGGGNRDPKKAPLSAEQLENVFGQANAGNWKPFERAFVDSSLPDEEFFARLAQS